SSDDVVNPTNATTRYVDNSESDIVYQISMSKSTKKGDDVVTIGVHELVLNEKCPVFDDDNCEKVFVSVEFLDYPAEYLETPYALVKGEPNTKYSFDFQTECSVRDQPKKQQLAELVEPRSSGEIKFVVVAEPPEDQPSLDCVDIGVATVNAKQLLHNQTDHINKSIDVYGMDDQKKVVGQMNVTVSIVQALNKVTRQGQNVRRIQS
ncbi:unnamed protein product, partial [Rotaria sordida]